MVISNKRVKQIKELKQQVNIKLNDIILEVVPNYKYLGIYLDQQLNYDKHIGYIKSKISQRHYVLRKIRWSIGFQEAMLIFKSCILPYLDVGDIFYSGANNSRIKSLQVIQNKCLRTIYGPKHWPGVTESHRSNNLLMCQERRELNLLKYAHKRSFVALNLRRHMVRELRSSRKLLLNIPKSNCKLFSKSYVLESAKMWNSLNEDLKRVRDVKTFVTRVKKELHQNKLNFPE